MTERTRLALPLHAKADCWFKPEGGLHANSAVVHDANDRPISTVLSLEEAEFIVTACNSRAGLVEALAECVDAMHADDPSAGWADTIARARARLKPGGE